MFIIVIIKIIDNQLRNVKNKFKKAKVLKNQKSYEDLKFLLVWE